MRLAWVPSVPLLSACLAAGSAGQTNISIVHSMAVTAGAEQMAEPQWTLFVDRAMAAELTSERSVAECEASLADAGRLCVITLGSCASIAEAGRGPEIVLVLLPWRCHDPRAAGVWEVPQREGPNQFIPVEWRDRPPDAGPTP